LSPVEGDGIVCGGPGSLGVLRNTISLRSGLRDGPGWLETRNEMRFDPLVLLRTDLRTTLTALFIVTIMYGDVWLGITIPVSMLLLPIVFIAYSRVGTFTNVPLGFMLLLGMAVPLAFQYLLGRPLSGKSDAVVYLPVAYAMATMFVLQRAQLPDRTLWHALSWGGFITALVMVLMLFLPARQFLVPGQDLKASYDHWVQTEIRADQENPGETSSRRASIEGRERRSPLKLGSAPAAMGIYRLKELIKNALGRSNYIAAFFVFLFTVSMFHARWSAAGVFVALTLVTLSRFGLIFLGIALLLWILHRRGFRPIGLAAGTLGFGLLMMFGVVIAGRQLDADLPMSVANRLIYWQSGVDVIGQHVLVGAPRSHFLYEFNIDILWHPHNVLLWVGSLAGVIGLMFYLSFVGVALIEMYRSGLRSGLWAGTFFGFVVLLTWSLFEPIAFTPAFDVLLAALYTLARNDGLGASPA
jgi:hypothetical protein